MTIQVIIPRKSHDDDNDTRKQNKQKIEKYDQSFNDQIVKKKTRKV